MPPVKFQITTDGEKALYQLLQQAEAKADKAQQALLNGGRKGKAVYDELGKSVKNVAENFTSQLGALEIIRKTSELIRGEWERISKLQAESQRSLVDVGNARVDALRNAAQALPSVGGVAGFDAMAERVSKKSKLDLASVYKMLSSGFSAKGEMSNEAFENAALYAAHVSARSGGAVDAAQLLGQGIDLSKVTGLPSAQANMGWLMQIGSAARVVSSEGMGKLISPIQAAMTQGAKPEWAASMEAAISQMIGDATGERSSTGFAAYLKALEKEVVPYKVPSSSGKLETKYKRLAGKTPEERSIELQKLYAASDEETRADIKEKLGGEATTLAFYEGFLQNTPKWKATLAAANVPRPGPESAEAAKVFLSAIKSGPFGQAVERDLDIKRYEGGRSKNPEAAFMDNISNRVESSFKRIPKDAPFSNPMDSWSGGFNSFMGRNTPEGVANSLESQLREMPEPLRKRPEYQEVAELVKAIREMTEEFKRSQKENAEALKNFQREQSPLPALNQQEQ